VDDVASSGPRRLVVRVEGGRDATWARGIPGITVSEVDGGEARLVLDESVDSESVVLHRGNLAGGARRQRVPRGRPVDVRRIRSGRDQRRALAPVPSAHQLRARVARGCRSGRSCRALATFVMEPGSLIMERKMLLGIKRRAEMPVTRSTGEEAP